MIKDKTLRRAYWLQVLVPGRVFYGKHITQFSIAFCCSTSLGRYIQQEVQNRKMHPYATWEGEKFPAKSFSFAGHKKRFGFNQEGVIYHEAAEDNECCVIFELPNGNTRIAREIDSNRIKFNGILYTLAVLTSIGNKYLFRKQHQFALPMEPAPTQQLCITIVPVRGERESYCYIACEIGAEFHCFMQGKPNYIFKHAEMTMGQVYRHVHNNIFRTPFRAVLANDDTGNLILQVPGKELRELRVTSKSVPELHKKEVGYSMLSTKQDTFPETFGLLAGLLGVYDEFQNSLKETTQKSQTAS